MEVLFDSEAISHGFAPFGTIRIGINLFVFRPIYAPLQNMERTKFLSIVKLISLVVGSHSIRIFM